MKTVVTLIKNGQKKDFTERAAKIAVESFGWQEIIPLKVPAEIGTKTRPPEIKRLIEPAVTELKPVVAPSDDLAGNATGQAPNTDFTTNVNQTGEVEHTFKPFTAPVKKTRKPPVRSKTTKK